MIISSQIVCDENDLPILLGEGRFGKVYLFELHDNQGEVIEYAACKFQKDRCLENVCNPDIDALYVQEYRYLSQLARYSGTVRISRTLERVLAGFFESKQAKFPESRKKKRDYNARRITRHILAKLEEPISRQQTEGDEKGNEKTDLRTAQRDKSIGLYSVTRRLVARLAKNDPQQIPTDIVSLPAQVTTRMVCKLEKLEKMRRDHPKAQPSLPLARHSSAKLDCDNQEKGDTHIAKHSLNELAKEENVNQKTLDLRRQLAENRALASDKRNDEVTLKALPLQMTKRLTSELKKQVLLAETTKIADTEQQTQLSEKLPSLLSQQRKVRAKTGKWRKDSPLTRRLTRQLANPKADVFLDQPPLPEDQELPPLCPPLLFNRTKKTLLVMPCPKPTCSGKLKNCRKDIFDLLYRKTALRFLYCPECLKNSPASVKNIYCEQNLNHGELGSGYRVITKEELLKSLIDKIENHNLQIFSFYESFLLPLTVCHFPLNTIIDVISQREAAEIIRESGEKNLYFGPIFPVRAKGENALEVLHLKLQLFAQICQAVSQFHKAVGKAHLNVEPSSVMLRFLQYTQQPSSIKCAFEQAVNWRGIDLEEFQIELLISGDLPGKAVLCKPGLLSNKRAGTNNDFDPLADLYGLGMLLLHILVGRNERKGDIREILCETLSEINGNAEDVQAWKITEIISRRLRENAKMGFGEYFASSCLYWKPRETKMPEELWIEVIVFAFRLITDKFHKFSFYQRGISCEESGKVSMVAQVLLELNGIVAKIEQRLFGRSHLPENMVKLPNKRSKSLLDNIHVVAAGILAKMKGRK